MSSEASSDEASKDPSRSSALAIRLHVFECGQGDTLILVLPGERLVLVDCHLPKGRIRDAFFKFVEPFKRLDLLVLSHPDFDHYHGMGEVIDHFTTEGRSLGAYCDSGVDAKQIANALRLARKPGADEYEAIQLRLDRLIGDGPGMTRYLRFDDSRRPERIEVSGYEGNLQLVPIAPTAARLRTSARRAMTTEREVGSLNEISLVLVLRAVDGTAQFNGLLAGDADPPTLARGGVRCLGELCADRWRRQGVFIDQSPTPWLRRIPCATNLQDVAARIGGDCRDQRGDAVQEAPRSKGDAGFPEKWLDRNADDEAPYKLTDTRHPTLWKIG
jgi:hypothetical protein